MKTFFTLLIFTLLSVSSFASDQEKAEIILNEWSRIRNIAMGLEPEFKVGGLLNGKVYGNHEFLWVLDEEFNGHEILRLHYEKTDGSVFQVSYHRGSHIIPGVNVVRRFIGPFYGGWKNHTVALDDKSYLGSQGAKKARLDEAEKAILDQWGITPL